MNKPPLQLFPNQGPSPNPSSSKPTAEPTAQPTAQPKARKAVAESRPSVATPRDEEIRMRLLPIENQIKVMGLAHYLMASLFVVFAAALIWYGYDDFRRPSARSGAIACFIGAAIVMVPGLCLTWLGWCTRRLRPWTRGLLGFGQGGSGPWARSVARRTEEFLRMPEVDHVLSDEYVRIVKLTPHIKKAYKKRPK